MSAAFMIYPYELRCRCSCLFLLWEDRESGGDRFVTDRSLEKIIGLASLEDLKQFATNNGLDVSWEEAGIMDLNRLSTELRACLPGEKWSVERCRVLLEGWNFFEDLFRTLSLDTRDFSTEAAAAVYEKIFCGNNLPFLSPNGENFDSVLDESEVSVLQSLLGDAMSRVTPSIWAS